MKEVIRQKALELGFDSCRFTTAQPPDHARKFKAWLAQNKQGEMDWLARNAHKRIDPQQILSGAKSIIVLAVSYAKENTTATNTPTEDFKGVIARYAQFADYHDVIAEKIKALTDFVDDFAKNQIRSLWYVDTGPLLERDLAQRAGLGFVGKHTNLISRTLGNWIFLSEIITTTEFPPDESEKNRCGSCTSCISACPTNAITAPFDLDARRCISYLTIELKGSIPVELRPLIGNRIYGCDDCLEVCPWNRFAQEGAMMAPHARRDLEQANLLELLNLDNQQFKQRFAGTPILRTKRRGLLRNVCVALGNIGNESALPALTKAAEDVEPLISEHASWAIAEIQQRRKLTQK